MKNANPLGKRPRSPPPASREAARTNQMHVDDGVVSTVGVGDELEPRWAPHFCEITLKVYTLYEVDTLHGQFGVDFTVMLDWRDRTLAEAAARGEAKTWLRGEHWFPDVLLDNAGPSSTRILGSLQGAPPKLECCFLRVLQIVSGLTLARPTEAPTANSSSRSACL